MKRTIKHTIATIIFVLSIFQYNVFGQQILPAALKPGDRCPDFAAPSVINHSGNTLKLSDFKGKLIILDFWDIWCSACIASFPHMDSLQAQFKDKIQIILVTYNTEQQVRGLMKHSALARGTKLPIIVNDVLFNTAFPPKNPHHVWISTDNEVLAITEPYNATVEHINAVLDGGKLNLNILPANVISGTDQPLFARDKSLFMNHLRQYSIFLSRTPNFMNLAGGVQTDSASGKITRIEFYNRPVLDLYRYAFGGLREDFNQFGVSLDRTRIMVETRDSLRFREPGDNNLMDHWLNENTFCYESMVPPALSDNLQKIMQQDLERFFGIKGSIEKRKIKCLVLNKSDRNISLHTGSDDQPVMITSEGIYIYRNKPISKLVTDMEALMNFKWAIADQTGIKGNIDLDIQSKAFSSLETAKEELRKHGLNLTEQYTDVELLVIKDAK